MDVVSDRSAIREFGHYLPQEGDVRGIDLAGPGAYLASGNPGLGVLDISDPRNPREVERFDTPRPARSVQVAGPYAYLGDLKWLSVLDISSPSGYWRLITGPRFVWYFPYGIA